MWNLSSILEYGEFKVYFWKSVEYRIPVHIESMCLSLKEPQPTLNCASVVNREETKEDEN